jgi:nicotinamidase-related amidase
MEAGGADWLVVIDMQSAFAVPESPWCTPSFGVVQERISLLLPLFGERVVFTRFVPPAVIEGSWGAYYRKWPFAMEPDAAAMWALAAPWRDRPSVDSHRFSKWGPELRRLTSLADAIVLCGVSTECCVLGTALAAVDDGVFVRIVADACGAKTPEIHNGALSLLEGRAPQLVISDTGAERSRLVGGDRQ